jgi:hypothetical protein
MDIIITKPGLTVDSRKPKRKRFAAVPAKLWQAGVVMRIMPHPADILDMPLREILQEVLPTVQNPINLAMGSR